MFLLYLSPAFKHKDLRAISRDDVKKLVSTLLSAGKSRNSVEAALTPLTEMFSHAVEDGHISVNPALRVMRRTRTEEGEHKQGASLAGLRYVRIHDLRHSYASLLLQNGESLVYVKDQMGHHSIQVTVDTYGRLTPGGNKAAVGRLDGLETATIRNPVATGDMNGVPSSKKKVG
jgi:site-specific recombinase XerD